MSAATEREKALSVRYVARLSLISSEAKATSNVRIIYDSQDVQSLWVLSVRLENTGNQPIELTDIEKPLSLIFKSAKVLGAEIGDRNPRDIEATTSYSENAVFVQHGLMNPGDWLGFEILFDGAPDWPEASFRISGISAPIVVLPPDGPTEFKLTFFSIPRQIEYFLLGITSIGVLIVAGFAISLVTKIIWDIVRLPSSIKTIHNMPISIDFIPISSVYLGKKIRSLLSHANLEPSWTRVDNPDILRGELLSVRPETL